MDSLKAELRALTLVHEKYQAEAQEKIRDLLNEISSLKSSSANLEAELAHEKQRVLDVSSELSRCQEEAARESARLQGELDQTKLELASVNAQLDHLRSKGAKEIQEAQAAKGRYLAGVIAAHHFAAEVRLKAGLSGTFGVMKDRFYKSQVGGMELGVVNRIGFGMARWSGVHQAFAIAQWKDRVTRCKLMSMPMLVPDWYADFDEAKEKLIKLRHQQVRIAPSACKTYL